jgi:hypothetical protein
LRYSPTNKKGEAVSTRFASLLFHFPPTLLSVPLSGESRFHSHLFARLQIERMPLDLFNDVFLLHLALEATEGVFQRFPLLQPYFSQ